MRHSEDSTPLPSVPYEFPNGQGDVAKFLNGKENGERWEKTYGPIYRIWSGMAPEIVLTRPEHIQAVFKDSDRHLKAKNNNSGFLLGEILGRCVGLISQDDWKRVRAVVEAPFARSTTTTYRALVQRRTKRHLQELRDSSNLSKGLIHPAQDLKMLPFWVVAEVIYGELDGDIEQDLRELAPIREAFFKHVIRGGLGRFEWSKHLPTQANKELHVFKKMWAAFNTKAYERARRLNLERAPIVGMYDAVHRGTITEEQLLHTLDEMLYANLDVTLGGLSWNLVFLAAHPDAQTKIREESAAKKAAAGTEVNAPDNRDAYSTYLSSAETYVQACITESSRLRPLAAFSVPQAAPTARVIGGYFFPAGTNFIVDSYALNQRNPYWGADAALYRPERHFRKDFSLRFNMWRFGFGPRQCLGKYVADLAMRVLLVELLETYQLDLQKTGDEWGRDRDMWINHPDLVLKCTPRS